MKLLTFSETKGTPAFSWWHALEHPEEYQHSDLMERADAWATCAVGQTCATIPRDKHGAPVDELLARLGREFSREVDAQEWSSARATLFCIEARVHLLLNPLP